MAKGVAGDHLTSAGADIDDLLQLQDSQYVVHPKHYNPSSCSYVEILNGCQTQLVIEAEGEDMMASMSAQGRSIILHC